jgi:hypothetical protein
LRKTLIEEERHELRLDEFKPRVLSSFVRNKLINDVYLPMIGDNLAKQMGAAGAAKRTDLMGMLLLISPPGYGKTTLMEYVANRLGLVFMKVNGPSLGHGVVSLDPAEATNATARQEVEKINLAFEMGNNVMLYLDDIQHTHPELLQKFISLCDGQRRVEGVWKGKTQTYDLRGKRFCVCMAGNPYTESGETFQIPDMLANRADIYNLGDVLSGKEETFGLSYLENSLTSNPVLAPLAGRDLKDVHLLIRMAQGEEIPATDLSHPYGGAEMDEILSVLKKMLAVRDVLFKVNAQYIASAATDDRYREEPPFRLQGSYRNMNKVAEKVVAVMDDEALQALIDDHYRGEAQTLTTDAEQNLLKLNALRGRLTDDERVRWQEITHEFVRLRKMGGADDDPQVRALGQLASLSENLEGLRTDITQAVSQDGKRQDGQADKVTQGLADVHAVLTQVGGIIQAGNRGAATRPDAGLVADALRELQNSVVEATAAFSQKKPPTITVKAPAVTVQTPDVLPDLGPLLEKLAARPMAQAPGGAASASGEADPELKASLNRLEHALRDANLQVQVVNQPPAGVQELMDRQLALIEKILVPLVKSARKNMQLTKGTWEQLETAMDLLRKIDRKALVAPTGTKKASKPFKGVPQGTRATDE